MVHSEKAGLEVWKGTRFLSLSSPSTPRPCSHNSLLLLFSTPHPSLQASILPESSSGKLPGLNQTMHQPSLSLHSVPAPHRIRVIFLSNRKILDFIKMLMAVISG